MPNLIQSALLMILSVQAYSISDLFRETYGVLTERWELAENYALCLAGCSFLAGISGLWMMV